MNGTGSMGFCENAQSLLQVRCFVKNVPNDVGPGVSIASHFYRVFWRQPDLLAERNVFRYTCHGPHEACPAEVGMFVKLMVGRVVDNHGWVLADEVFGVPVESPHVKGLSIGSSFSPDSCNCAGSFNEFGEDVEPFDLSGCSLGSDSFPNALDFLNVADIGVPSGNSDIEVQDLVKELLGSTRDRLGHELRQLLFKDGFHLIGVVGVEPFEVVL